MGKHLAEPVEHTKQPPIWRTKIALSAVLMVTVIILTILGFRWLTTDHNASPDSTFTVNSTEPEPLEDSSEAASLPEETSNDVLVVHVAGEVQQPGIVELEPNARVVDAIESAGGPTDDAQLDALNLAAVITDGEYILVPDRQAPAAAQPNPPAGTGAVGGNTTVNINTADSTALETLPGVGPATAEKIISHREQHGAFAQLADLEAVSGIGPATLERLDGLVTW